MQTIVEDTRNKPGKHDLKGSYFKAHNLNVIRSKLVCGDYAVLTDLSTVVDSKESIQEVIGDIQFKAMGKKEIQDSIYEICRTNNISFDICDDLYHIICDDDSDRNPDKEIDEICIANDVPQLIIGQFKMFYIKRHGFFHRGLIRSKLNGIKLYILVENTDGIKDIRDLFSWVNPRLKIWKNSKTLIGYCKNGKPRYKKVQAYPNAMTGEQLAKACLTMEKKYHCSFIFCKPEESGKKILELLNVEVRDNV